MKIPIKIPKATNGTIKRNSIFTLSERLKTLKGVNYITIDDFRKNGHKRMSPTYIIHKLKDGTYLKWETNTLEIL